LDPANGTDAVRELVGVYPAERMIEHPVSTLVNKVSNDSVDNISPLTTPAVDAP
jgi:putative SOS response-associated peptidase YedK